MDEYEFNAADWEDRATRTTAAHLQGSARVAVFGNLHTSSIFARDNAFHVGTVQAVTHHPEEYLSTTVHFTDGRRVHARDYALSWILWDHDAHPAEPDACKHCGAPITMNRTGSGPLFLHADDPQNGGPGAPAEDKVLLSHWGENVAVTLVQQAGGMPLALRWTDLVANDWTEEYTALPVALARFAVLVELDTTAGVDAFVHGDPVEFERAWNDALPGFLS